MAGENQIRMLTVDEEGIVRDEKTGRPIRCWIPGERRASCTCTEHCAVITKEYGDVTRTNARTAESKTIYTGVMLVCNGNRINQVIGGLPPEDEED